MNILIWAIVLVIMVLAEVFTMQLVSIWFAVASLVTLISSLFIDSFLTQLVVFVLISLVLLIFTKPILKKFIKYNHQDTNYNLDVGKVATVIETIDTSSNTGRVSLNGVDWNAQSVDDSTIEVGSQVIVQEIEGSKLLVRMK